MVRRPVTSARKDSCVTGSTGMTVPRKVISGNSSVRRNSRRIWPSRSPLPVVIERASIRTVTSAENVPSCSRTSACAETSGARPAKPPRLSLTKNVTRLAPPSNVNEPVGSNDSVDATSRPVLQRRARITFLPTPLVSQLFHATSRKMRPRAPTYPPDPRPPTMLRRLLSTLGDTETRRRAARSLAVLCGIGYALTIVVMAGTGLGLRRWFFALLVWGALIYIPLRILLEAFQTIAPAMRQRLIAQTATRPDRYASRAAIELVVDGLLGRSVIMPRIATPVAGEGARRRRGRPGAGRRPQRGHRRRGAAWPGGGGALGHPSGVVVAGCGCREYPGAVGGCACARRAGRGDGGVDCRLRRWHRQPLRPRLAARRRGGRLSGDLPGFLRSAGVGCRYRPVDGARAAVGRRPQSPRP